jgi:methyltransferase FkbM-like protein
MSIDLREAMKKNMVFVIMILLVGSMHSLTTTKKLLYEYAANKFSQCGEDGILNHIFKIIGTKSKNLAVEFGAWDGFLFSNTAALWANDPSWHAVLIEGDANRYKELVKNTKAYNVIAINAMVGIKKEDCLETILQEYDIMQQIDLLSIDVDGNDYHIFNSLKEIRPRVIVCEYNPTIPYNYDVYAPYSDENNFGQSAAALKRIAEKKGYRLVALTRTNAIFVTEQEFDKFANYETHWEAINVNNGYIVMVTSYDGKYAFINNNNKQNPYVFGIEDEYEGNIRGNYKRWKGQRIPACYQVINNK